MRVLYITAELYPWVKSGGLGDVAAALPPALIAGGIDVRLLLPGFRGISRRVPRSHRCCSAGRRPLPPNECGWVWRGCPAATASPISSTIRPSTIGPATLTPGRTAAIGPIIIAAFALLGWVAAELARGADPNWRPDLLHGHDWHAGLAPAYLAASVPETGRVPTVFTVHNLAYRGLFPAGVFPELALPPGFFSVNGVEFFGMVSFIEGRPVLRGSSHHGESHLCPRDSDAGLWLGSRRIAAQPRRRIDRDLEWRRHAASGILGTMLPCRGPTGSRTQCRAKRRRRPLCSAASASSRSEMRRCSAW